MTIKIAAQFKKDNRELNGLTAIEGEILTNPHDEWYIVARVINKRTSVEHVDGDSKSATVNLVHIEPMWGDNEETAKALLSAAYKQRTNNVLPEPKEPDPTLFDADADGEGEDQDDVEAEAEGDDESSQGGE